MTSTFEFEAELGLQVLLDTHAQDVGVDGQHHLLSKSIKLTLLSFDYLRHLGESLLELVLQTAPGRHLFHQAFLVVRALLLDRGKVHLEVGKQLMHLFFLGCGGRKCLLHGE